MILKGVKPQFSLQPMFWLAVSFCLGIGLGRFGVIPNSVAAGACVLLVPACVMLRSRQIGTVFVLAAFVALGVVCHSLERGRIAEDRVRNLYDGGSIASHQPVEIEGVVVGYPESSPDGVFIILSVKRLVHLEQERNVSGNVRLFLPLSTEEAKAEAMRLELKHGTLLRVACRLERENSFQNPGVTKRTDLLDRQGVDATANLKSPVQIERRGREAFLIPLAFVYELRANLVDRFRTRFTPKTAGILIASTFGNKYFLDKQTADVFREGGTFHVLVISGLHITFIGGIVLMLVRLFTRCRRLHAVVVIGVLWLYGIAVGAEPPVMRACVMFTVLMVGYASYHTSTLANSFGACILTLLVWKPSDLFDASFQLTVASVAGIICLGLPLLAKLIAIGEWMPTAEEPFPPTVANWLRRLCETIYWKQNAWEIESKRQIWSAQVFKRPYFDSIDRLGLRRIVIFVFDGVVISLAVQLTLLPFAVVYFHRISLASVVLNLWAGPLLAFESLIACLAMLVTTASDLAAVPFVTVTEILNWLLVSIPAVLTLGSFRIPIYWGWQYAIYFIYFLPVIGLCFLAARWNPFGLTKLSGGGKLLTAVSGSLVMIFAGLIVFHPFSSPLPDGRLQVEFLDVGQGDSAFITFPTGKTMLVDGGGRVNFRDESDAFEPDVPRIGEMVVSEFLWQRGISKIDLIVATHADSDHIQGLVDVAKNFSIGEAVFGSMEGDDTDLKELVAVLDRIGVPKNLVTAGTAMELDGVRIEVINPFEKPSRSDNNDSVVLRLTYGNISFLLTGDIERRAEEMILRSDFDLRSTVVKVPHHGSRSSSTQAFIDAVNAKYAVISVGIRSSFGHPHPEVVDRWKTSAVMTTGENGTIRFSTDGKELEISTFRSGITNRE